MCVTVSRPHYSYILHERRLADEAIAESAALHAAGRGGPVDAATRRRGRERVGTGVAAFHAHCRCAAAEAGASLAFHVYNGGTTAAAATHCAAANVAHGRHAD